MSWSDLSRAAGLLGLCLSLAGSAAGQTLKVIDKPGAGQWTISFSRVNGPGVFELDGFRNTRAEALKRAQQLKAWSDGMDARSSWRLAVILIEGEDAQPGTPKREESEGPTPTELLARLKEAKDAVDRARKVEKGEASILSAKERKLGDTIKEYKDMVQQSARQIVEARKTLTGGVSGLTEARLREVNALIDGYNRQIQDFRSVMGNGADLGFRPLPRVEPPRAELEIPGRWATSSNEWDFGADGTFQIAGTGNRGQWKRTADGIAIRYSGASVWINLTFVGRTLVDQKGFIGRAQLRKLGD
jgi:hypothetical protein